MRKSISSAFPAFTLLELLVYVALLSLFSYLLFSFVTEITTRSTIDGKEVTQQAHMLMVLDLIKRDLRAAPASPTLWKKIDTSHCIWHDAARNKEVSWEVKDNRLTRTIGTYDEKAGVWITKRTELIGQGVEKLLWTVMKDGMNVTRVNIEVRCWKKPHPLQCSITIRERSL